VDPAKIVVWDRRLDELNRHGKYSADDLAGAQLLGTRNDPPQDGGIPDTNTDVQPGYGEQISPTIECQSPRLSRILTELTDLTINCPVFKRHGVSGVTGAMKNIYGIIDIPGSYHAPVQTGLPKLYALPAIRNSISLNIVDALIAEVTKDTADPADFAPRRILLSQDPVAMDSYAAVLMNKILASIGPGLPPSTQSCSAGSTTPQPSAWAPRASLWFRSDHGLTRYRLPQGFGSDPVHWVQATLPTGGGVYWEKLRISLKSFPASPWDAIWTIFASIPCGVVVEPLCTAPM